LLLCVHSDPPAGEHPTREEGGFREATGRLTNANFDSNWDETVKTFDAMDLPEELLRGIYSFCFEKPSAIAIRPTMLGNDLIA
jgi:hypothetical protein